MQASDTISLASPPAVAARLRTVLQLAVILVASLVAGSTFGIWRGYNPATYSALTFLETHQGAVRGLNVLLPAMGMGALLLTAVLATLARRNGAAFKGYVVALILLASAGAITRFANQPINAEVMSWAAGTMPPHWTAVRDIWWNWHIVRMLATVGGTIAVILAVFADRRREG
jgi:hypothetical protein